MEYKIFELLLHEKETEDSKWLLIEYLGLGWKIISSAGTDCRIVYILEKE